MLHSKCYKSAILSDWLIKPFIVSISKTQCFYHSGMAILHATSLVVPQAELTLWYKVTEITALPTGSDATTVGHCFTRIVSSFAVFQATGIPSNAYLKSKEQVLGNFHP